MTIVKRLIPLMLAASILLCLPSCKNSQEPEETDDALSMLLEIVDSYDTTAASDYYVIVIPSGCTSELAEKARALSDALEEITGVDSVVEYDEGDNPLRSDAIEIILGNTIRNESRVALAELSAGDYVCKKIDGSVVIGGIDDADTVIAVERFMTDILPYSSAEQLMSSGAEFEYFADPDRDDVLLCGFLISDFGIVCEADDDLLGVANEIKGEILDRSGSELEVSDAQRIGLRDIVLRLEASDGYVGEGYILYDGEDVILSAYDIYGMQAVASSFCSLLLADKQTDEICLDGDWSSRTVKCPNRPFEVELISFDEETPGSVLVNCITSAYNGIIERKPALVLISDVSANLLEFLSTHLPDGYSYRTFGLEGYLGAESVLVAIFDSTVESISVDIEDQREFKVADISVKRTNGEPDCDISYLYTDLYWGVEENLDGITDRLELLTSKDGVDLVLVECGVADNMPFKLPEGSLLLDRELIRASNHSWAYIDVLAANDPILLKGISCEDLKKDGVPFGFLSRVTRISFARAEFNK
ncbi:MAG: hypothetical protein IKL59_01280 [Clostridia bacterium]|nr:hypothetical protein [Clostridia bacterium]